MPERQLKSRIVHKHDIESNWLLATNFTPKQGEIIIYDIDENYSYERIKIGDGSSNVNDLPFVTDGYARNDEVTTQIDTALEQKSQVQMITPDSSKILPTLKIHKITQEQYDQEVENGTIDENALYLTPEEEIDLSPYATIDALNAKADMEHKHEMSDITNLQSSLDEKVSTNRTINGKALSDDIILSASDIGAANSDHTHDDLYYTESEIDAKISGLNTSIENVTNGTVKVADSSHADEATHAVSADNATTAVKASQDEDGNVITSTYETKADATTKLNEAKGYTDSAVATVKNDLLNGAGEAYDTLKELGDLIDDNTDAISALETIASGKADADHTHNDIYYTETEIDELIANHKHDALYDTYGSANTALEESKIYTDNAVAQKTQVQIITWGEND